MTFHQHLEAWRGCYLQTGILRTKELPFGRPISIKMRLK